MIHGSRLRFAGWSAYFSAVATIIGFLSLLAFFIVGQPFGTINDVSSVVLALSIVPVLFALYELTRPVGLLVPLAALSIGIIALLIAALLQSLLVAGLIAFGQTGNAVTVAFGAFGLVLMVFSYLTSRHGLLSRGLARWGMLAGAGYVLVITGFILGGEEHPLTAVGGLTAVICYPIWAIGFARLLLSSGRP